MKFSLEYLHVYGVIFLMAVYTIRIIWFLRFRTVVDRSRARANRYQGALFAMTTLARPWSMESTRKGFVQWVEFAIFHIGIAVTIAYAFLILLIPEFFTPTVNTIIIASQFLALGVGLIRLYRRLFIKKISLVSSGDDIYSVVAINAMFITTLLALFQVPNGHMIYNICLTVVIVYVPFSKIEHYLFYPFARYYYGSYLGNRGVYR